MSGERRCVRDMVVDVRGFLDRVESDLDCGMSREKFAALAVEAEKAVRLLELCRERFVEKSQGA